MDRALHEGNRVVSDRAVKLNKIIHKEKIRNASKGINNNVPHSVTHPINRRSKEFQIEGECCLLKVIR